MKKVYMIMVDEWMNGYVSTTIEGIHATLDGAKSHFQEITAYETVYFVMKDLGRHDTTDEALKQYGIKKRTYEFPDGTMDFCIEYEPGESRKHRLHTLYVHIYEKYLLD